MAIFSSNGEFYSDAFYFTITWFGVECHCTNAHSAKTVMIRTEATTQPNESQNMICAKLM